MPTGSLLSLDLQVPVTVAKLSDRVSATHCSQLLVAFLSLRDFFAKLRYAFCHVTKLRNAGLPMVPR